VQRQRNGSDLPLQNNPMISTPVKARYLFAFFGIFAPMDPQRHFSPAVALSRCTC
jgi:hypothetical protein